MLNSDVSPARSLTPCSFTSSSSGVEDPTIGEQSLSVPTSESFVHDQELSEDQLRQLYDTEEVERFMCFFSAYVTEVRFPGPSQSRGDVAQFTVSSDSFMDRFKAPPLLPKRPSDRSFSEHIAHMFIIPYLPPEVHTPSPFTVKRLRLTSQRLYLAIVPPYQTFLSNMASLALWKDKQRSSLYCICFWILWYHDILPAALLCRILWSLLRRRLLPYPSLTELLERRQNAVQACRFGEEVQRRLSVSTLGPVEMWRLFRFYKVAAQNKVKTSAEDKLEGSRSVPQVNEHKTVVENIKETQEAEDLKRDLLHLLEIIADFHERIKNIFTWRRPAVTRRYAMLLAVMAFGALALPVRYFAKLVYLFCGAIFWHLVPVIVVLSPADRARVPALLGDAPTDAEYATELIRERILKGQDVTLRNKKRNHNAKGGDIGLAMNTSSHDRPNERDGVNWRKWGARAAKYKSVLEDGKSISSIGHALWNKVSPDDEWATSGSGIEQTHTFPAQHSSSPGLITLTSSTLYFTSLTSTRPRLDIPLSQIQRVRKASLMKGLLVSWILSNQDAGAKEREERFHWVGGRDELFARLLRSGGG